MSNPVPGRKVTTPYGRHGSWWCGGKHGGVDFAAPTGTPVVAAWSGVVTGTSWGSSFGIQVVIDQDGLPGGRPGLWAVYAHLSRSNVKAGQRVRAGQKIGEVGATGNATGAHLHYEVQPQGDWRCSAGVNPEPWLAATPTSAPAPAPSPAPAPAPEEDHDMRIITSPKRGSALYGAGYFKVLTDEAYRVLVGQGIPAKKGNDREFDLVKAAVLQGASAADD